jgi:hypothetical protein
VGSAGQKKRPASAAGSAGSTRSTRSANNKKPASAAKSEASAAIRQVETIAHSKASSKQKIVRILKITAGLSAAALVLYLGYTAVHPSLGNVMASLTRRATVAKNHLVTAAAKVQAAVFGNKAAEEARYLQTQMNDRYFSGRPIFPGQTGQPKVAWAETMREFSTSNAGQKLARAANAQRKQNYVKLMGLKPGYTFWDELKAAEARERTGKALMPWVNTAAAAKTGLVPWVNTAKRTLAIAPAQTGLVPYGAAAAKATDSAVGLVDKVLASPLGAAAASSYGMFHAKVVAALAAGGAALWGGRRRKPSSPNNTRIRPSSANLRYARQARGSARELRDNMNAYRRAKNAEAQQWAQQGAAEESRRMRRPSPNRYSGQQRYNSMSSVANQLRGNGSKAMAARNTMERTTRYLENGGPPSLAGSETPREYRPPFVPRASAPLTAKNSYIIGGFPKQKKRETYENYMPGGSLRQRKRNNGSSSNNIYGTTYGRSYKSPSAPRSRAGAAAGNGLSAMAGYY